VIASNNINEEMNQMEVPVFWPERRYPWGTAQAFNPDHSDLLHLRCGPLAFCGRMPLLL
jgi:septin 7